VRVRAGKKTAAYVGVNPTCHRGRCTWQNPYLPGGDPGGGRGRSPRVRLGKQVLAAAGCNSCHTLKAANATGTVGPNLDEVLRGRSAASIRESIIAPNAKVSSGFQLGTMPSSYGTTLSGDDLTTLVRFLQRAAAR
jgi:cytochrome c oxidase subunit 2